MIVITIILISITILIIMKIITMKKILKTLINNYKMKKINKKWLLKMNKFSNSLHLLNNNKILNKMIKIKMFWDWII